MPKGPRGEKRPADVIGAAIMVARIATGEITEHPKKVSERIRSGATEAKARAAKLSDQDRSEISRRAA